LFFITGIIILFTLKLSLNMKAGLLNVASPDILTTLSNFASLPEIDGAYLPFPED
jgi:hypothetical protein